MEFLNLDWGAWEALITAWGGTRANAREVWQQVYRRGETDFTRIETLPPALRERLMQEVRLDMPLLVERRESPDGETRKDLLRLSDGEQVEVVLLRYGRRRSVCVSTQVGCPVGCLFCATGQMGFVRSLSPAEILAQVLHFQRAVVAAGAPGSVGLSNVVLMGMGEPLLNEAATVAAIQRLVDQRAFGFPRRRVTLSTVGVIPAIERLARDGSAGVNLAVSLHAATDELRGRLIPLARRYPLEALKATLRRYTEQTGRRVMIEWVLIRGVNDTLEQARALARWLDGLPAHVNLIRLNPTAGYAGRPAGEEAIGTFAAVLDQVGVPHTVRQRRGKTIEAGCGQLRRRVALRVGARSKFDLNAG